MLKKAENNYCTIKIVNARQLRVEINSEYPSLLKKDNEIISLTFPAFTIDTDDELELNNQIYKINYIEEETAGTFILTEEYITMTSRFLFTLIFPVNKISSEYFYKVYFYNAYLYCDKFDYDNCIYVVYRFFNADNYKQLESKLTKNKNFIKCQDFEKNKVLFAFKIPEIYHNEINFFKHGKLLKYSTSAKDRISCFYKESDQVAVDVIKDCPKRRRDLEHKLDCRIPKGMATITKPIINIETLKLI